LKQNGLTLAELLIVLLIIGLGWFSLLPRLDLVGSGDQDNIKNINTLLTLAGEKAREINTFQSIFLIPGQNYLEWEQRRYELPATLSSAEINGHRTTGQKSAFTVYPAGHMDELNIFLVNGKQLRSRPLLREIMVVDE